MGAKKKARFNQTNEEFCVFVFGKPKIFRKISEKTKNFSKNFYHPHGRVIESNGGWFPIFLA
jgi:hypothetical protein